MGVKKIHTDLSLEANTLTNIALEQLAVDPTGVDLYDGRIWYDTTLELPKVYNGTEVLTLNTGDASGTTVESAPIVTAPSAIEAVAVSTDVDDWNPTNLDSVVQLELTVTGPQKRDISGIVAQAAGRRITLINKIESARAFVLKAESNSSTAANRLGIAADITVEPGNAVDVIYVGSSTRWAVK